jgi:hypothetical protein
MIFSFSDGPWLILRNLIELHGDVRLFVEILGFGHAAILLGSEVEHLIHWLAANDITFVRNFHGQLHSILVVGKHRLIGLSSVFLKISKSGIVLLDIRLPLGLSGR